MKTKTIIKLVFLVAIAIPTGPIVTTNPANAFFEKFMNALKFGTRSDSEKGLQYGKNKGKEIPVGADHSYELAKIGENGQDFINRFGDDITEAVKRGEPGYDILRVDKIAKKIGLIINKKVSGSGTANAIIVGKEGVGRMSVVYRLAQMIVEGAKDLPDFLVGKRIISIDPNKLTAGTSLQGDLQTRIKQLEELADDPNVILLLRDVDSYVPDPSDTNGKNLLKEFSRVLNKSNVIAITDQKGFRTKIEPAKGIGNKFKKVEIDEPDKTVTKIMTRPLVQRIARKHGVEMDEKQFQLMVRLCKDNISRMGMPGCVRDLAESVASTVEGRRKFVVPPNLTRAQERAEDLREELLELTGEGPFYAIRRHKLNKELEQASEEATNLKNLWDSFEEEYHMLVNETRELSTLRDAVTDASNFQEMRQAIGELLEGVKELGNDRSSDTLRAAVETAQSLLPKLPADESIQISQEASALVSKLQKEITQEVTERKNFFYTKAQFVGRDAVTVDDIIDEIVTMSNGATTHTLVRATIAGAKKVKGQKGLADEVKENLENYIVGQKHVVERLIDFAREVQYGMRSADGIQGMFLLLGKSRLGKTYTPEIFAKAWGDGNFMVIPMGDYKNLSDLNKLKGAPPGYAGYDKGGIVPEALKTNPNMKFVWDEISRAHPKILEWVMKFRDNGKFIDDLGEPVDATNSTFFFTTNDLDHIADSAFTPFLNDQHKIESFLRRLLKNDNPELWQDPILNGFDYIFRYVEFTLSQTIELTNRIWIHKWLPNINKNMEIDVILHPDVMEYLAKNSEGGNAARVGNMIRTYITRPLTKILDSEDAIIKQGDFVEVRLAEEGSEYHLDFVPYTQLREMSDEKVLKFVDELEEAYDVKKFAEKFQEDVADEAVDMEKAMENMEEIIRQEETKAKGAPMDLSGLTKEISDDGDVPDWLKEVNPNLADDPTLADEVAGELENGNLVKPDGSRLTRED